VVLNQWRSQPENFEGGSKNWGAGKMFGIRRITLFCLEKRLSKQKMTIFSKHFGGITPLATPAYAYVFNLGCPLSG